MVGGGFVSWLLIIPFIAWQFGDQAIAPRVLEYMQSKGIEGVTLIGQLTPDQIWDGYIRIIGAGAVAAAGIITVIKSIPTMVQSLKIGIKELRSSAAALNHGKLRTEQDLSIKYVLAGVILVILAVTLIPGIIGKDTTIMMRFFSSVAIAFFAFIFVTVSSRIVGLIGVSSNPTSGMAIVTILGTGVVFLLLGWTDLSGKFTAITIGTIVCIAASIAGDISQDLKAGFLVGATPRKQQIGEILGAIGSAFFVCLAVYYLGQAYGFGSEELAAPQATLMKTVLDGVLNANLNWLLVGIGAIFAVVIMFFKIPPLPFAVGMYLPLSTMTPVFIGGMVRHFIEKKYGKDKEKVEKGKDEGILMGSGFIAGEGLMGIIIAIFAVIQGGIPKFMEINYPTEWMGMAVSSLVFGMLGWYLYRIAAKSRKRG
jgi:putative OPT family oligopeptide transporter